MKKPDITKGEWVADGFIIHGKKEANYNVIANSFPNEDINFKEAQSNAQAISAVPDMIDALIRADRLLRLNLPETNSARQKIRKALTKAGVKL